MDQQPLITVYITNYNYGKFIQQAVESVLNQTYKNIEIIIVDDGSTDNSKEIIEQYSNLRFIEIVYQHRKGLNVSNNIALRMSRGEFIVRLDADDYFDKNALKILINEFDHDEVGMVFGDWYNVDTDGNVLSIEKRHDFENDVKLFDQPAHGACTMFRTRILKKLQGYDEAFDRQDGYEIWFKFIEHYKVKNINVPIFYYRKHGSNLTNKEKALLNTRSSILEKIANKKNNNQASVLAIIPIRGSSIDHNSKPFKLLNGKYLIDWTLEVFEQSDNVREVIVTTPDLDVLDHVKVEYQNSKIRGIKRPIELARIGSFYKETIMHSFDSIDNLENFSHFLLYTIESPFLREELIDTGINTIRILDVDTVIAVSLEHRTLFSHSGIGLEPVNWSEGLIKYEKEQLFAHVTDFWLREINSFLKSKKVLGQRVGHVVFDKKAAFEIRDEIDFVIAEQYIKHDNE